MIDTAALLITATEPKPAMTRQHMKDKRDRLADKYHTCTCSEYHCRFALSSPDTSKLVDMDLENSNLESPFGRMVWFTQPCLKCGKSLLRGRNLCDSRITGAKLLESALETGKEFSNPDKALALWQEYQKQRKGTAIIRLLVCERDKSVEYEISPDQFICETPRQYEIWQSIKGIEKKVRAFRKVNVSWVMKIGGGAWEPG
jgi:hypothetical protein